MVYVQLFMTFIYRRILVHNLHTVLTPAWIYFHIHVGLLIHNVNQPCIQMIVINLLIKLSINMLALLRRLHLAVTILQPINVLFRHPIHSIAPLLVLINWDAYHILQHRGVCLIAWRIPASKEFYQLINALTHWMIKTVPKFLLKGNIAILIIIARLYHLIN